jgi:hypothetical protein
MFFCQLSGLIDNITLMIYVIRPILPIRGFWLTVN